MTIHKTAKSTHYDNDAKHYDAFNEKKTLGKNKVIEGILKKNKVKTVLDMTCGTGSQVFYLDKKGYEVVGLDINNKMLQEAKGKDARNGLKFIKGDMRTSKVGKFDSVITIFNAVGHLTKKDFEKAMKNIGSNLSNNGLYIFDIFNSSYLLDKDNITKLTIDWPRVSKGSKLREIQYSTIDEDGVLASYTTIHEQFKNKKPKISRSSQTLQIYSVKELQKMLEKSGFKLVAKSSIDGDKFSEKKTEHMLLVARKMD